MYSPSISDFIEIPTELCSLHSIGKIFYSNLILLNNSFIIGYLFSDFCSNWPKLKKKLDCFDLFSGCGGLSSGLRDAGLINTKWAVSLGLLNF